MTTREILPSAPRPLGRAIHCLVLAAGLGIGLPALAKTVSWEDIANDHVST